METSFCRALSSSSVISLTESVLRFVCCAATRLLPLADPPIGFDTPTLAAICLLQRNANTRDIAFTHVRVVEHDVSLVSFALGSTLHGLGSLLSLRLPFILMSSFLQGAH